MPHLWVQACCGLIEENYLGTANGCDGEAESSFHAPAEAAYFVVPFGLEVDKGEYVVNFAVDFLLRDTFEPPEQGEVVLGSELVP